MKHHFKNVMMILVLILFANGKSAAQEHAVKPPEASPASSMPADRASFLKELIRLGEAGDAEAQNKLGQIFDSYSGTQKRIESAWADEPKDDVKSVMWYRRAAEQGLSQAQFNLAQKYELGVGVVQDFAQAASWYRRAADQGDSNAQAGIGFLYAEGKGVPKDYAQAVAWYRRSATQGNPSGQLFLGVMHSYGRGVEKDRVASYMWCSLAGAIGDELRNALANRMNKREIAEAQRLSSAFVAQLEAIPPAEKYVLADSAAYSSTRSTPQKFLSPTARQIEFAKERIGKLLKDPYSAKYEELYLSVGEPVGTVCGQVNSKNSYGAYAGAKSFLVTPEGRVIYLGDFPTGVVTEHEKRNVSVQFSEFGSICLGTRVIPIPPVCKPSLVRRCD